MSTSILSKPEIVWFIIGLVLFVVELILPGFVIFFFGVGAWVTALLCLFADPGINVQIIVFATVSVLSLLALRKIIQRKLFYNKVSGTEDVEDEFTGKEAIAITDFNPGSKGKVEFKGTRWNSESKSEIKAGQTVIIMEKENLNLIVKPKNK